MTKKATDIICYISIVGWLVAFFAGTRKESKFHLNQALTANAGFLILNIASRLIPYFLFKGLIFWALDMFLLVITDMTRLERVQSAFARYTSPEIADFVLSTPEGGKQGGQSRQQHHICFRRLGKYLGDYKDESNPNVEEARERHSRLKLFLQNMGW